MNETAATGQGYTDVLRAPIQSLPVYQPGRPIEIVAREFGLDPSRVIKLASNENPLGSSPLALEKAQASLRDNWLYPDNSGFFLTEDLARALDLPANHFVLGAGSNEIFYLLADLFLDEGAEVIMGEYAFISYRIATIMSGAKPVPVAMPGLKHDLGAMLDAVTERTRVVFLPNPNNPTGTIVPAAEVLEFARSLPEHVVFCYDEAYVEYQEDACDLRPLIREGRRIVCTRTFSKIYGLAGFRIGYGYCEPELARLLNAVRPPFNTSLVAQAAARGALADAEWVRKSRQANEQGLLQLAKGFDRLGIRHLPSAANFVLAEFEDAEGTFQRLQRTGVIVRPVAGYGLPSYLRVSVGTAEQNDRLLDILENSSRS